MSGGAIARRILRCGDRIDPADTVTLDYESRFLRRKRFTTDSGATVLADLAETVSLDEGDALETTDGRHIVIRAASEDLIEIRASGAELARLAWHIGNRHTPAQIGEGRILIRRDHVLAGMLARLGAETSGIVAPFKPEGGAYGYGRTHGHDHLPHLDSAHLDSAHHDSARDGTAHPEKV
jgi:urease accessory protein